MCDSCPAGEMVELQSKEQWQQLLDSIDTVLLDCDGVLWSGTNQAIPGAQDTVKFFRAKGKSVYFVSNNSSKSRKEYLQKFAKLNFEAYEHEIFCTAYIAAYYLKHMLNYSGKVYLIGMPGFGHELELAGMTFIGPGVDPIEGDTPQWAQTQLDPEVGAIIVGFDRHFSYAKLIKACSYAKNRSCHFIGTNKDASLPIDNDQIVIPGTGCLVDCVKYGAEREPIVIGKPNEPMFQVIQHCTKLDPARTLMIGDRLATDMQFGLRYGMKTLLVLTGAVKRAQASAAAVDAKPNFFAESIAGFLACKD